MNGFRAGLMLLLLVGLWGFVSPALAQSDSTLVAVLTLDPLEPQPVGIPITITAHLLNQRGLAVPNKVLILYVDGERMRQIRTDELGIANIRISRALPLGTHQIDVVFLGTAAYREASASMPLTVRPIRLTVETVPHIANVSLSLEGQTFVTNAQGLAQMEISQPGTYHLRVMDVSDIQISADTRVSFSRWSDSTFQPERTVDVGGDLRLQVGFTTSHPIGLSFADLSDNAVDAGRVSSVTLKRSDGSYFTFEDSQPQWLMATRVVRRPEGLEAAPLLYSVESVMVDGTNAVNRYQQRFYVEQEDTWAIQLLLYSARIHATDAFFGFPIGRGVTLQYPDGHSVDLSFGANRDVSQSSLARGLYHVRVKGVIGMTPFTPIALSKDQEVELKVLTGLDIGVGVASGLAVALALLFLKRPHLLTLLLGGLSRVPRPALQLSMAYAQTGEVAPRPLPVASAPPAPSSARPTVNVALASTHGDRDTAWLVARLHPEGFKCPHCGHTEARMVRKNRRSGLRIYRCCACQNTYTLYTGTPFAGSRLTPAQCERLLREDSLSRTQLVQELGLTKKTVRKWQRRLQAAGELPRPGSSSARKEALRHNMEEER